MTYIIEKFEAGEVVVKDFVCGWEFAEGFDGNYEHRPLMADAMKELLEAGLITSEHVDATATARSINLQKNLGTSRLKQSAHQKRLLRSVLKLAQRWVLVLKW